MERIFKLTRSRFQRFELTCEGVYALVNLLEKNLNVSVVYEPGDNRMGVFYGSKKPGEWKGLDYILLDGLPEMAVEGAEKEGITSQQFLVRYFDKRLKGTFDKSLSNNLEYSVKAMGEVISLRWRLWEE